MARPALWINCRIEASRVQSGLQPGEVPVNVANREIAASRVPGEALDAHHLDVFEHVSSYGELVSVRGLGDGLLEASGQFGIYLGLGQAVSGALGPVQGHQLHARGVGSC